MLRASLCVCVCVYVTACVITVSLLLDVHFSCSYSMFELFIIQSNPIDINMIVQKRRFNICIVTHTLWKCEHETWAGVVAANIHTFGSNSWILINLNSITLFIDWL